MGRLIHFELATDNPEATAAFYRDVFGWTVKKWEGPVEYWLVTTGEEGTPGIDGGLMVAGEGFRGTVNTIGVDDLDAALARALAHGAELALGKQVIPGVGYQAYVKDISGILIGLHQPDEKAGMGQ